MSITRILKEVSYFEFSELINRYKSKVKVSSHAYFRLSEMQRNTLPF